jgi:hypothetical protein
MGLSTIRLQQALLSLDFFLTDKRPSGWKPKLDFEEFWYGREYYLSDGGYSRIYYEPAEERLLLGSVSIDKPKERWNTKTGRVLREKVEQEVKNIYEKMDENTPEMDTAGLHNL